MPIPRSNRILRLSLVGVALLAAAVLSGRFSGPTNQGHAHEGEDMPDRDAPTAENAQLATFGGGCFWCTEAVFVELEGVYRVTSGYSGGRVDQPTYEAVCRGTTGHAEGVQVEYDPDRVSYEQLLEVFWKTHDPTTLNRQGNDVGTQYRSVVFYHDEAQREAAESLKKELDASGAFSAPIVTEITAFEKFFPAEQYHQDYYQNNPNQGYCQYIIQPKIEKFRKVFSDRLKTGGDESPPVPSQAELKERLTPIQYHVTQEEGTERAFTGEYWDNKRKGVYDCVVCNKPLFDSETKYESGTGWPSFFQPIEKGAVSEHVDRRLLMTRTEVRCAHCDAHLGHVFEDGPQPTGLRYCMNSAALDFEPADQQAEPAADPPAGD